MGKNIIIVLLAFVTKVSIAQTALTMQDTRAIPTAPESYNGTLQGHFKAATTIGLSSSYYYTVFGLRGWVDDSGGKAHELAFGDENNVYIRSGYNSTGWGGWRTLLVSNDDGNFGIGLTNFPTEKLTVNGNIKLANRNNSYLIDYASLSETYSGASTILGNNVIAGATVNSVKKTRSVADAGSFVSLNYYYGITFHTGVNGELNVDQPVENSEKMRITQSGNVGIGTLAPTEKLTLNGNVKIDGQGKGYKIEYASLSETKGAASTILGNNVIASTTNNAIKKTYSAGDAGSFVSLNYLHGITFHTGITGELNVDQPVENSEKMRIVPNGNIGIGTTSPQEKLSVNGTIKARAIKVDTQDWPDYIFESSYKVGSLEELDSYIKANKHLPEMPSAKEVMANGLNLGDIVKLQQKKIEELTLQLIELNKKVNNQQNQIKKIAKKH